MTTHPYPKTSLAVSSTVRDAGEPDSQRKP